MTKASKQKRFTLSLPDKLHEELTRIADLKGISSKDVVIKSLKLGMIAFEVEDNPSQELIIREKNKDNTIKETHLIII